MDGYEVARRITQAAPGQRRATAVLVALTGYGLARRQRALERASTPTSSSRWTSGRFDKLLSR